MKETCPSTCSSDIEFSGHPAKLPFGQATDYMRALPDSVHDLICAVCAASTNLDCCHNHPHRGRARALNEACVRALAPQLPPQLPPPSPLPATVDKDPHLHFANGGRADFRGRSGRIYNFFSAPGLAVNVKTEESSFRIRGGRLTVDGSFITEAHFVARVGGARSQTRAYASFWAAELNHQNWGWNVLNGTCGSKIAGADAPAEGLEFVYGKRASIVCDDQLSISIKSSSAAFSLGNWTTVVKGNHVYGWISGAARRLDIDFKGRGDAAARDAPHGTDPDRTGARAPPDA